jgi:CRP-like cAMP-binding protein
MSYIPADRFESAVSEHLALRDIIAKYNEVLLAETQQIAACNAVHPAEGRLCRWLLQTRDRIESDDLPLTQEFLSQMLGVRRTTVTLAAKTLQAAGLIDYRRGKIKILDGPGLEAVVCECYGIIQHQKLRQTIGVDLVLHG